MASGFWGKKLGMTQVFSQDKVIPVTAIDISKWIVTGINTKEKNGYASLQIGCVKDRYANNQFEAKWMQFPNKYFLFVREIPMIESVTAEHIGKSIDGRTLVNIGDKLDITGKTIGRGFAGVVKRHNFNGPPGSHGSCMGKRPGASSSYRSQGRVIPGKRFPGHMGTKHRMSKALEVVKIEEGQPIIFVKGSVPGKAGTLLSIMKV